MSTALGTGLPTKEELRVHYPAKFTWEQLKTFVNSGDLGLLKRDKRLQERYDLWATKVKAKYGSTVNYLVNFRLQWGKQDTLSLMDSALDDPTIIKDRVDPLSPECAPRPGLGPLPSHAPPYFNRDTPPEFISIIQNDWPYSVPESIEHSLVWCRVPIFHPSLIDESIRSRIEQDGLCGFTGLTSPPPSPSLLPLCLPALAEWGITKERMILSPKATPTEQALIEKAGSEVHEFVKARWEEARWETAWFVNPPRLQSVPELAHVHVFAKLKT